MPRSRKTFEWVHSERRLRYASVAPLAAFVAGIEKDYPNPMLLWGMTPTLTIDLNRVSFCSMFGVLTLASTASRAMAWGCRLSVLSPRSSSARAFLQYYGLGNLLARARSGGVASITPRLDSGTVGQGKRVFSSRPIFSETEVTQFRDPRNIRDWISELGPDIARSDFFENGRFARVVSAEIGANIAAHAQLPPAPQPGLECFGVVGMRIMKTNGAVCPKWLLESYSPAYSDFVRKHAVRGFAEICVCDPGIGICTTLSEAFGDARRERARTERSKGDEKYEPAEILQFAFDEFGSRKRGSGEWMTEAHALSRILGLVNAYGGILSLRSGQCHITYRLDRHPLQTASSGMGYEGEAESDSTPWGTFFQILVPLTRLPQYRAPLVTSKDSRHGSALVCPPHFSRDAIVIPVSTEFPDPLLHDFKMFCRRAEAVSSKVRGQPSSPLLLDFSGTDNWPAEHVALLLDRFANVARGRLTLLIGMPASMVQEIEDRVFQSVERVRRRLVDRTPFVGGANDNETEEVRPFLACLVDYDRVIPAIDTEGKLHWIGAETAGVATALTALVNEEGSLKELLNREYVFGSEGISPPSVQTLSGVIRAVEGRLFQSYWIDKEAEYHGYRSLVTMADLDDFSRSSLVSHFQRHLRPPTAAMWGHGGRMAFLLPHVGEYTPVFIETTRLFQEEGFSRDVGQALSRLVWLALGSKDPQVLVCSTAPTVLMANAMRPWFGKQPCIVDIGHYFDQRRKSALGSLTGLRQIVVVQDVISSGQTVDSIADQLSSVGAKVAALASLVEFKDDLTEDIVPALPGTRRIGIRQDAVNHVSLYWMKHPGSISEADLVLVQDDDRYWVEPYSLHPFSTSTLKTALVPVADKLVSDDTESTPTSVEFAKLDLLRVGHFVYEEHHFGLITKMKSLLEGQMAERIANQIADLCLTPKEQPVLLFPLHSHIRYIVPRVMDILAGRGQFPAHMYAVAAREVGPRAYYMLPQRLHLMMRAWHRAQAKGRASPSLRIVIVDDAMASGRTLETLLRAIRLADCSAGPCSNGREEGAPENAADRLSCIGHVIAYAAVSRLSRARSTFFANLSEWAGVPFSLRCFAEFDIRTHDELSCPLCAESEYTHAVHEYLANGGAKDIMLWLEEHETDLQPVIADTPKFDRIGRQRFPAGVRFCIDGCSYNDAAAAICGFLERSERGYPAGSLLESFSDFCACADSPHDSVGVFKSTLWRWFLTNWDRVASDIAADEFFNLLYEDLRRDPSFISEALFVASWRHSTGHLPSSVLERITASVFAYLGELSRLCGRDSKLPDLLKRESLFSGLRLLWASLSAGGGDGGIRTKFRQFLEELPDEAAYPGDFQGSLRNTLRSAVELDTCSTAPFLQALRLSSAELMSNVMNRGGKQHANRVSKHLRQIIGTLDHLKATGSRHAQVMGSISFLTARSQQLLAALHAVLERGASQDDEVSQQLANAESSFGRLIRGLNEVRQNPDAGAAWSMACEAAEELLSQLFTTSGVLYKEIAMRNVRFWPLLKRLRQDADRLGVGRRLVLPTTPPFESPELDFSVFGDPRELMNLLENHTTHVLREGRTEEFVIRVDVEPGGTVGREDEVVFVIQSDRKAYMETYKALTSSHGLRLERWGLHDYGYSAEIVQPERAAPFTLAMRLKLQRGYT